MANAKKPAPEGGGRETQGPPRRTAVEETERLTNMAAAIGAGVALVPIPGTAIALSGIEILLMGAIMAIWGQPLTKSFFAAMWAALMARFAVAFGLKVAGDVLGMIPGFGTLIKPAIAGGVIKLVGAGMSQYLADRVGEKQPAAITAEEARDRLKAAIDRLTVLGPELKGGMEELIKGNGARLAATLNKLFGLGAPPAEAGGRDEAAPPAPDPDDRDPAAAWEDDDGTPPKG